MEGDLRPSGAGRPGAGGEPPERATGIRPGRNRNWSRLPGMGYLALILLALPGAGCGRFRWVAYYSDRAPSEEFRGYGLVVFDSDRHPPLARMAAHGQLLLGYLSLGEIDDQRAYFPAARQEGILIGRNPVWPGSYYVDVRDRRWRDRVIRQLVPAILAQGFQGVFLDTLDDPAELERRDPQAHRGMTAAAVELVRALRASFPSMTIMMNRGYELLPDVAPLIDIALGESVYTTYDFDRKAYRMVAAGEYREQVGLLQKAKRRNPAVRLYSLDYWDPADLEGIRRIYRAERSNGFEPYVATIGLDRIVKEPE
jgi:polysaccharide biosynthesis protein PelA